MKGCDEGAYFCCWTLRMMTSCQRRFSLKKSVGVLVWVVVTVNESVMENEMVMELLTEDSCVMLPWYVTFF